MRFTSLLRSLVVLTTLTLGACATSESQYVNRDAASESKNAKRLIAYQNLSPWSLDWRYRGSSWSSAYASYGVFQDPWLYWDLRFGDFGSAWLWRHSSSWPSFGYGWPFANSRYGFWHGHDLFFRTGFGSSWANPYSPYYYYATSPRHRSGERGLPRWQTSTASSDRAFELMQQSERRRRPDFGGSSNSGQRSESRSIFPSDMGDFGGRSSQSQSRWERNSPQIQDRANLGNREIE